MATILENQASISYIYDGAVGNLDATSNITSTTLTDACSVSVTKTPLAGTFRNGDQVSYVIRIVNTGSATLSTLTITDDLSGTTAGTLSYVDNSLNVFVQGAPVAITPATTGTSLSFVLPANLAPGEVVIAAYTVTVDSTDAQITNNVTVTGTGLNPAGCSVSETASATITAANFADLSIFKDASTDTVTNGDTFSYTFSILNSGNIPATNVVLTDTLPSAFDVDTVTATSEGMTTIYTPADYTLDSTTNTITLPNATGTPITVPAATAQQPGVTTVTITGRII